MMAYTDGTSRNPIPFINAFSNASNGHLLEGCWVQYSGPSAYSKPLFTTIANNYSRGDSIIKVNADLSKQGWGYRNNERAVVFRHKTSRSGIYQNGAGFSSLTYYTAADSLVRLRNWSTVSDSLCEPLYAGDEAILFTFDSTQVSRWQYGLSAGWEEAFDMLGYYIGLRNEWLFGWPKRGYVLGSALDQLGLCGVTSEPHSLYRIYDPPMVCETYSSTPNCLRIYAVQQRTGGEDKHFYYKLRTMVYAYVEGAAGWETVKPTYTWTATVDTLLALKQSQCKYAKITRDSSAQSFADVAQLKSGVSFAALNATTVFQTGSRVDTAATPDLWEIMIPCLNFNWDSNSVNLTPFQLDSARLYFTVSTKRTWGDSLWLVMRRPAYMDSIKANDSTSVAPIWQFGPWGGTEKDSLAVGAIALSAITAGVETYFNIRSVFVPYLAQRIANNFGVTLAVLDSCAYNRVPPNSSFATHAIAGYTNTSYDEPKLVIYGKKVSE